MDKEVSSDDDDDVFKPSKRGARAAAAASTPGATQSPKTEGDTVMGQPIRIEPSFQILLPSSIKTETDETKLLATLKTETIDNKPALIKKDDVSDDDDPLFPVDFATASSSSLPPAKDEDDSDDIDIIDDDDDDDSQADQDSYKESDDSSTVDEEDDDDDSSALFVDPDASTPSTTTGTPVSAQSPATATPPAPNATPAAQRAVAIRQTGRGRARPRPPRMSHFQRTAQKLIKHHPELATVWDDLQEKMDEPVEPIEQPSYITVPLLPFQRLGVAWMMRQEKNPDFQGGVLADEMGMGKTIQTITLLLSDNTKPNLVIAPAVAIIQWSNEIEKFTVNNVKVHLYHGAKRASTRAELESYDIVITTYSVLESAFRRQEGGFTRNGKKKKERSLLHNIKWHRIVLDEAHNIKDRSSNTARAAFNLKSQYKWSLTGTPLQNRVGELYSLIRFMQADPFAYYYCKECPCKRASWNFVNNKKCIDCGHRPMDHTCWWNNEVLKPIQNHGYVGEGKIAMDKLRQLLLHMMLRRTKVQCADDLGLPPRTVVVRRDFFNEEEEEVYTSLFKDTARKFNTYVEEGTVLNHYANIFELLTRMRQCADHPDLITKKTSDNKQLVCSLCTESPEDAISSMCKHVFCRECITQFLQSYEALEQATEAPRCPRCYAFLSINLEQEGLDIEDGEGKHAAFSKNSIVNRIDMAKWRSSTKIEALVEELSKLRAEDRTLKSIVFSQFVNFLDLVYWRLKRAGFGCIRLDGTMTPQQRDAAIRHFMTDPTTTVFLISLKAGGVALNLTEASRVFICDPWWNPSTELQAMDRIHRLGQYRPVRITRLIIENSIESRIVQLQEKKMALVNSTIDQDQSAMDRLSVEDLRFLFVM
ncbi:SNF2 family N-terminal domain-containing protein [Gongronella butleri]|nr:SNF2 family N-terminal domain-containing protein [Gongronella butleri]